MKLKLKDILPNPDRDFALNPLNEQKIEELVASINQTGFWDNVVVRINAKGKPEAAHGHHRIEAAKRAGLKEADFIIRDWTDEEMLKSMADENSKEYDYNILALLESVKGVVLGLASGKIKPFKIERTSPNMIRYAPSFSAGGTSTPGVEVRAYTAAAISGYLKSTRAATQASDAVLAALNALELLEKKYDPGFLYRKDEDGNVVTLGPKRLLQVTRHILSQTKDRSVAAKKAAEEVKKHTDKMAELDAKRREEEKAEKDKQAELLRVAAEARKEEDEKKAKEVAAEIKRRAEMAEKRQAAFEASRAALDEKVKESEERAAEARKADKDLPTRHAVRNAVNLLNNIISEKNAFRETLKELARNKAVSVAERENIRQALLAASSWYDEQALAFRPVVKVDILKELKQREEAKHKREDK